MSKTRNNDLRRSAIVKMLLADIKVAQGLEPECTPEQYMFVDPRDNGSLKLTEQGYALIKDKFPHWSAPMPDRITFDDYVYLIEVSTFPYYIDDGFFITFDPDLGVLCKMVDVDFVKLKSLHPRS